MDKNSYTYNRDKDYRRSVNIIYSILFIILALAVIGLFLDAKDSKVDTNEAIQLEIVSDNLTNIILKDPETDQIYYANK